VQAPKERVQTRQQLVGRKRLDQIVVPTYEKAGHAIVCFNALPRDEQHRRTIAGTAELVANLVPGDSWQMDVQDDRCGALALGQVECLLAGRCFDGSIAAPPESGRDELTETRIVVDD
jgi:hypothetical protein